MKTPDAFRDYKSFLENAITLRNDIVAMDFKIHGTYFEVVIADSTDNSITQKHFFMSDNTYYQWCKGKTYYLEYIADDRKYHSGYRIKD